MNAKTVFRVIAIALLLGVLTAPVSAQAPNLYTSVSITNITGAPVVDGIFSTDVQVSIANSGGSSLVGAMGAEIFVSYNPTIVGVAGIDLKNGFFDNPYGFVNYENPCSVATGSTTDVACVHLELTQQPGGGPVYNRTGALATIRWMGIAAGVTELKVLPGTPASPLSKLIDADGIDLFINNTTSAIIDVRDAGSMVGYAYRQGYHGTAAYSGPITVTASLGGGAPIATAYTDASGYFTMTLPMWGTYTIQASYPGYMTARKDNVYVVGVGAPPYRPVSVGTTTLRGGEVNLDNCVNIYDLTKIAVYFSSANALVDINDDGTVNIYDLTLAASNFGHCGPTTW